MHTDEHRFLYYVILNEVKDFGQMIVEARLPFVSFVRSLLDNCHREEPAERRGDLLPWDVCLNPLIISSSLLQEIASPPEGPL
jgi:hypothetical protein